MYPLDHIQIDEQIRRCLRTRQCIGQWSNLLGNAACVNFAGLRVRDIDENLVNRDLTVTVVESRESPGYEGFR